MSLKTIKGIAQFIKGTDIVWENFDVPIPKNILVIAIDSKIVKLGDGKHKWSELPIWLNLTKAANKFQGLIGSYLFENPTLPNDIEKIVFINGDARFAYNSISITELNNMLSNITQTNNAQDLSILDFLNYFSYLDLTINVSDNGKITIISEGKLTPSSYTIEQYISFILNSFVTSMSTDINSVKFYSDDGLVNEITELSNESLAYVKIDAFGNDSANSLIYTLESNDSNIIINERSDIEEGVFSIDMSNVMNSGDVDFSYSADNGYIIKTGSISINVVCIFIANIGIYGDDMHNDIFTNITRDNDGNYYAVGSTGSEGNGGIDALIVKFDSNLNIINRKTYGDVGNDVFRDIIINQVGNLVVIGYFDDPSGEIPMNGIIMEIDNNLDTIIQGAVFSNNDGNGGDIKSIAYDYDYDRYILVGNDTPNTVTNACGIIISLSSSFDVIYATAIGDLNDAEPIDFNSVIVDDYGDYVVVGIDGSMNKAFLGYFGADLSFYGCMVYGGSSYDEFNDLILLPDGNYAICGQTASESSNTDSLIIISDSETIKNKKRLFNGNNSYMKKIIMVNDTIYFIGFSDTNTGFIIEYEYDSNDGITLANSKKELCALNGNPGSFNNGVLSVDGNDILCVGESKINNASYANGIIAAVKSIIPVGSYVDDNNKFTYRDMTFTEIDSALTLSDYLPSDYNNYNITIFSYPLENILQNSISPYERLIIT